MRGILVKKIDNDLSRFKKICERRGNCGLNYLYHLHLNSGINSYNLYDIKSYWKKLIKDIKCGKKQGIIELYVHIPFCIKKCAYCNYYSKEMQSPSQVDVYIENIIKNIKFFKSTFEGVKFGTLYLGGGTPSILNLKQLKKLFSCIFKSFEFENDSCKTFEFNPLSISFEKIDLIKKFGFNRLSFGIQTFDKKLLSRFNRPSQDYKSIKKIVQYTKKLDFKYIDADLIVDLKGRSPQSFIDDFYKVAKLNIPEIEIFPLIPTEKYLKEFYDGDYKKFHEEHKLMIRKVAKPITTIAKKLGYVQSRLVEYDTSWGFRKENLVTEKKEADNRRPAKENLKKRHKENRSGLNPEIFSFMGFGPSSISHIYGYLAYTTSIQGVEMKFNPSSNIYLGTPLSEKEEMIRYIIGSIIKSSSVPKNNFKERFGEDINKEFGYPIKALKLLGKIREDKEFLYFLPKNQEESLFYSLFFLTEDYLKLLDASQRSFSC